MLFNRFAAFPALIAAVLIVVSVSVSYAGPLDETDEYLSLSRERITVYHTPPDARVARTYMEWASLYKPRPPWLASRGPASLSVYIAPTMNEFYRLSGGRLPEWGVACAIPGTDIIIVRSPRIVELWREQPREILYHEITHVFLDQLMEGAVVPRWFHEGYAQYVSRMWGMDSFLEFSVAMLMGRVFALHDLRRDFPDDENSARRAYLQSYTVVEFMFSRWNESQMQLLIERWRASGDLDTALRTGLGLTLGQMENLWREWAGVRYGWLKLLTSATLIWIGAAVLFLVIFVARRRRYKRKLEQMRLHERRFAESIVPVRPYRGWSDGLEKKENDTTESTVEGEDRTGNPPEAEPPDSRRGPLLD